MGELIVLLVVVTAAVPGILLAAACHWLLVDRVPPNVRRLLCAVAAMAPALLPAIGGILGAYSGTRPAVLSLVIWLPIAMLLERRGARSASTSAGPPLTGGADVRELERPPARATVDGLPASETAAAARPADTSVVGGPLAGERSSARSRIGTWLIAVPWLVPMGVIAIVFTGLIGPFYESNGGVILIALGVVFALLLNAIGVVVLIGRAVRGAWRRRA